MNLKDFLQLHQGGNEHTYISIYANMKEQENQHVYCEEEKQQNIVRSKWFEEIKEQEVVRFCIGESYANNVELYIEIIPRNKH